MPVNPQLDIPWDIVDQLYEVIKQLIESCTNVSREDKIATVRNPGPFVKYRVRRAAKRKGIELNKDQWDAFFAGGPNATDSEIELLLGDWSAF
jgi:LDH2 family malate/lactate/ureidoglycolate dehydrogenase